MNLWQIRYLLLLSIIFSLVFSTCEQNKTPTEIILPQPEIKLSLAEDPYLTEIYLKLEIKNAQLPQAFRINRNGTTIINETLTTNDTTVVDTGLTPSTSYDYRAYRLVNGQKTDSASLQAATMDTTSHEIQWEIIEIASPYGSGVLRDVAIINEDNIWAVGKIFADSAQPWLPYNAVHWDGQQWELKRILYQGAFWSIKSIFAFASNDILFDTIVRWNGENFTELSVPGIFIGHSINKMWGTSGNDLYVVGSEGLIAHYNGSSWQKIESGTELNINDIWGSFNQATGEYEILCIASNHLSDPTYSRKILKIKQNQVINLSSYPIQWTLYSTWFIPQAIYFVAGSGIYEKRLLAELQWQNGVFDITSYYIYRIRGNHINDVIAVGGFGEVVHFNGFSWKSCYNETSISGNYYSVDVKEDIVVAVGYHSHNAVIALGRNVYLD